MYKICKILMEKIMKVYLKHIKDPNTWKDTPCLWIRGLSIIKISVLLK